MNELECLNSIIQKYKDYELDNVEIAPRIMKGKKEENRGASKEDYKERRKLRIEGFRGNIESKYKYYQLSREIYENGVKLCLDALRLAELEQLKKSLFGLRLSFLERKLVDVVKSQNKKCIKKAISYTNKMNGLGKKMGKKEVQVTNLNMTKVIEAFIL